MKSLVFIMLIVSLLIFSSCNFVKSNTTTQPYSSTQTTSIIEVVKWNLSGTVMPKPQYGSGDISGSEKASILTVEKTEKQVQITGEMFALNKNTLYTVLLANGYTANTDYPGLFRDKEINFTFMSNPSGAYSWTFILLDNDFPQTGTYKLSIWIKETVIGKFILISDNFNVNVK